MNVNFRNLFGGRWETSKILLKPTSTAPKIQLKFHKPKPVTTASHQKITEHYLLKIAVPGVFKFSSWFVICGRKFDM